MRILFYSPDSYGLGHVRRTISLSERMLGEFSGSSALVLTGAPRAHYFSYPARCDYLKLPSVTKGGDGAYASREIDLTLSETVQFRGRLIQESAASFRPDVLLVDHSPLGLCGEVLPTLESLRLSRPGALRVLGMRDVIDEPEAVRESWARDGVFDVMRRHYDLVLVYGQRDVFDPISSYGIPPEIAKKTVFAGYIHRNGAKREATDLQASFAPRTGTLVTVTVGGGGDGNLLLRSVLKGLEGLGTKAPFETLIVTGPLMSPAKRARIRSWVERVPGVSTVDYFDDMPGLFRASRFVVAMGGYNTICELACAGASSLIVPRLFPRKEQLVRAERLAARGAIRCLPPTSATPEKLAAEILAGLERPRPARRWGLDFSGLDTATKTIASLTAWPSASARTGGGRA